MSGDCYLVTGSIGPQFQPRLFKKKPCAERYVSEIEKLGRKEKVFPAFSPCIEPRWKSDMFRMGEPE